MKVRRGPDGIHLFNRRTGTNILLDEIVPDPSTWTISPRQVSIALTNACDLFCSHCYAPKQKAALDKNKVMRWMTELDDNGCFGIGFGGGEPTLYPELADICEFGHSQTNLAITMTTHGHHLNEKLLAQLEGNVNFIRVSMDGVAATYESIRNRSFNGLLKILRQLGRVIPFGLNYVVNNRTIGDIQDAVQIAESLGASEFLLLPEEGVGKGTAINSMSLNHLKDWVNCYRGPIQLAISSGHEADFPVTLPLEKEPKNIAFAHIDAEGNLKHTSFDCSGLKIGDTNVMSIFRKMNKEFIGEFA